MSKILLIDDEAQFRSSLAERLRMRNYQVVELSGGKDAGKTIRIDKDIEVVVLDLRMPDFSGEQALKEMKALRPELQVIILTGHGSPQSAVEAGKMDAFCYLQKPIEVEKLIEHIEEARKEAVKAVDRLEIPKIETSSFKSWLIGRHNYRPGFMILGFLLFFGIVLMPTPQGLIDIVSFQKTGTKDAYELTKELNLGYKDYSGLKVGQNIADYYGSKARIGEAIKAEGEKTLYKLDIDDAAFRAKVMIGLLLIAGCFWASGAIPIGVTALLVGLVMYFFNIMRPDDIAASYGKDSVIFIFGILAMAVAIHKTGLDRRIGVLLMKPSKSLIAYLFIFLPLLGISCSFLSEHAMVAFMMPILMMVYAISTQSAGIKDDPKLAILLCLSLNFAANLGGPGSPAAGGRNTVMIGILADYGNAPSFGDWVFYGLHFVPVGALVVGLYFYIVCYRKMKVKNFNISKLVSQASEKIGPMTSTEVYTAIVLVGLITLWIVGGEGGMLGMGGPILLALVVLNVLGILTWKDVSKIQWEVVALYAGATAMGAGLATTGAALYLAHIFIDMLPEFFRSGEGLAIAASFITGTVTNFMSDGATVAAVGPITVPMATISGTHPWMVGFATAFASSFAHMFLPGTPNNAIVFALAKNPLTGERVITLADLAKHGFVMLILSFLVLWFWLILGYWQWVGF